MGFHEGAEDALRSGHIPTAAFSGADVAQACCKGLWFRTGEVIAWLEHMFYSAHVYLEFGQVLAAYPFL